MNRLELSAISKARCQAEHVQCACAATATIVASVRRLRLKGLANPTDQGTPMQVPRGHTRAGAVHSSARHEYRYSVAARKQILLIHARCRCSAKNKSDHAIRSFDKLPQVLVNVPHEHDIVALIKTGEPAVEQSRLPLGI